MKFKVGMRVQITNPDTEHKSLSNLKGTVMRTGRSETGAAYIELDALPSPMRRFANYRPKSGQVKLYPDECTEIHDKLINYQPLESQDETDDL